MIYLSTTNQYWEPSCDPCYVDEAWFKVTFTTSTTVRCIQLSGIHPLGKSEGDTADLIWSGGLHVLNNNNLDQISTNSNKWTGRGIGDRLVADTKADCKVCTSGMYQQEIGKLECKNCPEGTVRYNDDANDNHKWDGGDSGDAGCVTSGSGARGARWSSERRKCTRGFASSSMRVSTAAA